MQCNAISAHRKIPIENVLHCIKLSFGQKLWSSSRALGSRSEGREFDPRPMLDGNGVKAMPG